MKYEDIKVGSIYYVRVKVGGKDDKGIIAYSVNEDGRDIIQYFTEYRPEESAAFVTSKHFTPEQNTNQQTTNEQ